jgi:hypothetical protein
MRYIVKCVNIKRARECAYAVSVLHGPVTFCTEYKVNGHNGSVVRPCEQ